MRYFPIFVDLRGQRVLVTGGGEQAAQKVRLLLKSEAIVEIVAENLCSELQDLATSHQIRWVAHDFCVDLLKECRLAYVASDDLALARQVVEAGKQYGVGVNVVDQPELCSFITPAIVDRDPVVVAIGTEGTAPVLARRIKTKVEQYLPSNIGSLAKQAASLRAVVANRLKDGNHRRRFWERFFDHPGHGSDLEPIIQNMQRPNRTGHVSLVGAGPGDPDLLTIKAVRALQSADVIVCDRLVDPRILELARRDARRIHVGKIPGGPSVPQEEINRILVHEASDGQHVVRLKGGDPFIFARGSEELDALEQAGIAVEVVPGITAALAAAASGQIALTERQQRRSLVMMTGHASDGPAEHDWSALAKSGQTLAIYMGVGASGVIRSRLLDAGIDPTTPVTIVENASLENERVANTTINELRSAIIKNGIRGPAMIFVGAHSRLAQSQTPRMQRKAA